MYRSNTLILAAMSALGLAACGSDVNLAPGQPASSALTVISSGNAGAVSKTAYNASAQSAQFAQLNGSFGIAASGNNGVAKNAGWRAAGKLSQGVLAGFTISNVPVGPSTEDCAVSGSVTVWGDVEDLETLTTGDVLNVDSDNCDDGTGAVVDGLLQMTITGVAGDISTGEYLLSMNLSVTSFAVTYDGRTETADGEIGTSIDTRNFPFIEGSVFGDSFTVGTPESTETLLNFSTIYTDDLEPEVPVWTNNALGTVVSSQFEGSVSYTTPLTFQGEWSGYPSTGQLLVTGANNASVRLIALDAVSVQIDADYDGNGSVDESFFMTWNELLNNQT